MIFEEIRAEQLADLQAKLAAAEQRAQDAQEDRDDYRISLRQAESHIKGLQQRAEQAEQDLRATRRLCEKLGDIIKRAIEERADLDLACEAIALHKEYEER